IRSKNPRRCQAENPLKLLSEFAGPALSAETARLMNVVEAIVAELERQGVAQTLDDLGFDLMAMARAVIRAADGDVVPLFPNQRRPE
ncbi:hypothetical protein, partial [Bradyrhizobium liaoningense]|uniref:hypothetical protein n=1 Tax=Bradyrhizobium liaoningense TaxID=43992 RepID=UPI001BAD8DF1